MRYCNCKSFLCLHGNLRLFRISTFEFFSKQSLEELGPIILMLKEVKGESVTEVPIMLVGNKKDEDQVIQLLFFPLE